MSVVKRLEEIRKLKGLNKSQFGRVIGKSSGYVNTLVTQGSLPGTDVLIKISESWPEVDLNWLLTGEGGILLAPPEEKSPIAAEEQVEYEAFKKSVSQDLDKIKSQLNENFKTIHEAMLVLLKGNTGVQDFLKGMNEAEITETAKLLQEYLQEKQNH